MAKEKKSPKEKAVQKLELFHRVVSEIGEGEVLIRCSDELRRLVLGVMDTGKKGKLTLEISVDLAKDGVVELIPKLDVKVPKQPLKPSIFFTTTSGDLSRDRPGNGQGNLLTREELVDPEDDEDEEDGEEEERPRNVG